MRLIRTWRDVQAEAAGAVVAVGNFDGVHEGHRTVIGAAVAAARTAGAPVGVLTFEPHPRTWFRPEQDPFRLTPLRSKVRQLEALGIDLLYVLPFDEAMATRTAEAFVEDILIGDLQVSGVVVGYDFVFGKGRTGSVETLQGYSEAGRFGLTVVPAVDDGTGASYSSTRIRGACATATRQPPQPCWAGTGRSRAMCCPATGAAGPSAFRRRTWISATICAPASESMPF